MNKERRESVSKDVKNEYEHFWKKIVENKDGSLNKDQVMKELYDFSMLIDNLSKLYCTISSGRVSKPMIDADAVLSIYEEELTERYNEGYSEGFKDAGGM